MTFRALPDGLRIADSPIAGQGLYATRQFRMGHNFGYARTEHQTLEGPIAVDRSHASAFINHSDTPNCEMTEPDDKLGEVYLKAVTDIEPGDELTVTYRLSIYDHIDLD